MTPEQLAKYCMTNQESAIDMVNCLENNNDGFGYRVVDVKIMKNAAGNYAATIIQEDEIPAFVLPENLVRLWEDKRYPYKTFAIVKEKEKYDLIMQTGKTDAEAKIGVLEEAARRYFEMTGIAYPMELYQVSEGLKKGEK